MLWGSRVRGFVNSLSEARPQPPFANPYRSAVAAHNLGVFLTNRDPHARTLMLIGEAPGYRGAALSGVALTSLAILVDSWLDPWDAFGPEAGYRLPVEPVALREATATMVWRSVADVFGDCTLPVTWNAVPFHPRGSFPHSNAPILSGDVSLGRDFLERLLDMFPNVIPVAVGRRAGDALRSLGADSREVRHPSRGGKNAFVVGLNDIRATAFV